MHGIYIWGKKPLCVLGCHSDFVCEDSKKKSLNALVAVDSRNSKAGSARSGTRKPLLDWITSTRGTPTEMNVSLHFSYWLAISHIESKFTLRLGDTKSAKKKQNPVFFSHYVLVFICFVQNWQVKEIPPKIQIVSFSINWFEKAIRILPSSL